LFLQRGRADTERRRAMIFLLELFTFLVALFVIGLLLIPLAAIWENVRLKKEYKKLERERQFTATDE
jgi:uncharacterized membrane protein